MMVRGVDDAFCGVSMEVSRKRLMVLKLLRKRDPRGWGEIVDLARVASVSYALCPDCIGILCLTLTGVVLGPDCIGILCSA